MHFHQLVVRAAIAGQPVGMLKRQENDLIMRHRLVRLVLPLVVGLLLPAGGLGAQEYPLLDRVLVNFILEEVSGDAAYEHVRFQTRFHRPQGGSDGLWEVAEYFEAKAREYGLERVALIRQPYTLPPWNARSADLWIVEPEPARLASTLQSPLHLADYSRSADVTAELVDVGRGSREELERRDVAGKIVLSYGRLDSVMHRAVNELGALGVVWYPDPLNPPSVVYAAGFERPDQIRWQRGLRSLLRAGEDYTFAFVLSLRQGLELKDRLASSDVPLKVRALVDAEYASKQGTEPWQVMVEGFIRGTEPELGQDIVLTAHMQEEGTSANDDASGTASALEVARALTRLIDSGAIPRPRRNIRFWWVTEISSQRRYFADHPTAATEMWVNINQDMVAANQAQGTMRKQGITRLPATRFHFFNDVVESAVEYVRAGNTIELAQGQAGLGSYPEPHLAHLGSRHRWNAGMIFFHNNSDHMPFNETPIGVPAVSFTSMPDHYIHSSDDDLWNVDPTQLGRSAATVALIAYTMATLDDRSTRLVAGETLGRGLSRLGKNLSLALTHLEVAAGNPMWTYHEAQDQLRFALDRERRALRSLSEIGPESAQLVRQLLGDLEERGEVLTEELEGFRRDRTERRMSDAETVLAGITPVLMAGPEEFLNRRSLIPSVEGLHGLMAFEVLNAVDGNRSGWDIFRLVRAESREGGAHYFGTVTPEAVLEYLRGVAALDLIQLR